MRKTYINFLLKGLTAVILLTCTVGISSAKELDEIGSAIKQKRAKWIATETSMSRFSPEERKKRLGILQPPSSATQQFQSEATSVTSPLLGSFDWRNKGGTNYVTSIKDQGSCGSCWAFATTAALESNMIIRGVVTNIDEAEQILVSCSGAGSCSGGYIDSASNFIRDSGLPVESYYPYTSTNGSCSNAGFNWANQTNRITGWHYVSQSVTSMKNELYTSGPLVTTMYVYSDFYSYGSGIYSHTTGAFQGYHAILIVGYTDDPTISGGGYFTVKNSWGTGWGESGYFRIAYSEVSGDVHFGYQTLAYNSPCFYTLSSTNFSSPSSGASGSVSVLSAGNCAWTSTSNASWITLTSGASGVGSGTVTYSVAANGGDDRTGTITVAGQNYTVVQAGLTPIANFIASPASAAAPFMVRFTDQSQRATSWQWDFGDGTSSTEQNPNHIYTNRGSYNVTLTASNLAGSNLVTKNVVSFIDITSIINLLLND